MATSKPQKELDLNTEAKIKNAARVVFHKKGFAGTRTRDIAEEAGINLALLNYYFRSKEKLFNIIMMETFQEFIMSIRGVFDDEASTLLEKITVIVDRYIDLLIKEPQIPLFILSEMRNDPDELINSINPKEVLLNSVFAKQYHQSISQKHLPPVNMLHFMMNLMSMTIFPFVASPLLKGIGGINDQQFNAIMLERKKMIPIWMKAILNAK